MGLPIYGGTDSRALSSHGHIENVAGSWLFSPDKPGNISQTYHTEVEMAVGYITPLLYYCRKVP